MHLIHLMIPPFSNKTKAVLPTLPYRPFHRSPRTAADVCQQFGTYKLIYRRYAGLFFTFGMDVNDNELLALETVHLFVELLESYFSNVCELDIVFNFNKAGYLVHEGFSDGECMFEVSGVYS